MSVGRCQDRPWAGAGKVSTEQANNFFQGAGHQADYYAVVDQQFLGTERFVDAWQARMKDEPSLRPRQSLPRALQAVATGMGRDVGLFQSADRSWAVSQQRTMAAYLLIRRWGYLARDVAAAFNRDPATLSSGLTRFVVRLREEPALQRALARLATIIKI
jgi:hypothetical protein